MSYTAENITVLEGLDPVRKTPGMYIGSTSRKGLNHMVYEIVDNSVDEHLAGYCKNIKVTLEKDGSATIEDDGRGIPVDLHEKGVPAERVILTTLHAGGKFDKNSYKTSGGLHGVGSSVVNALSSYLDVTIKKDGVVSHDRYEQGKPVEKLVNKLLPVVGKTKETGTKINFLPDPTIFEETVKFKASAIAERLHETAYLNPNLTIVFENKRDGEPAVEFHEPNGISGFVEDLTKEQSPITGVICWHGEKDGIVADIAFRYVDDPGENIMGFCNNIFTEEGGTHLVGFRNGFAQLINQYARDIGVLKAKDQSYIGNDVRSGMVAVVAIKHPVPRFEGQTKTKLDNQDAQSTIRALTNSEGQLYFDRHLEELKKIIDQADKAAKLRKAEEKSRIDIKDKKFAFEGNGKLARQESDDPSICEIFIVEGDSAGGSSKTARERYYQAILPIRGKILNVEKASMDKVLANAEIRSMVVAFGAGFGDDFDITKLKYDKIVIMCFAGDEKVRSLDGNSYSFKELVDNNVKELWVYAMDKNGDVVPALAKNIRQTGVSKSFVKITLDNGEIVTSTPEHFFLKADGSYEMAKELLVGDSLMPLNFYATEDGYEMFYDKNSKKGIKTHRMVAQHLHKKELEEKLKYAEEDNILVHHINMNKRNNVPENLEWLTLSEHAKKHNFFAKYNKSDDHRERIIELHKNGVYSETYFGSNGYNESGVHSSVIKEKWEQGCYKNRISSLISYNKSEAHKESVGKANKNPEHILSVAQAKIGKSLRFLILSGLPIDEHHYNLFRMVQSPRYSSIENYFESTDDAIAFAMSRNFDFSDYKFAKEGVVYNNNQKQRNAIAREIKRLIDSGIEVNEANYKSGHGTPKFSSISKYYDSLEEAVGYAENYNHKVVSVEFIESEEEQPVYCLEVPEYHNFLLDTGNNSGIFAKNCDADVDGDHISTLLLTFFYRFMPELIQCGKVYRAMPPLFKVEEGSGKNVKDVYLYDEKALEDYRKKHRGQLKIQRYKGLGEMDAQQLWETTLNPATRKLKKIEIEDAIEASKVTSLLMGSSVEPRKNFILSEAKYANIDQ